jgi:glycerophosphoryl diester phosphodiesterase
LSCFLSSAESIIVDSRVGEIAASTQPLIIAHRGASGLAPENTMAAFSLALALGADGIELDVQLSADSQPVVIHDAKLDRTTAGRGPVSNFTAAEIGQLDAGSWFKRKLALRPRARALAERAWKGRLDFAKERVPTLEMVLDELAPRARIYIELKGTRSSRPRLLSSTIEVVRQCYAETSVTLLSFDHAIIGESKRLAPELRAAILLPGAAGHLAARSILEAAKRAGADEVALHFGLISRRTVAALQDAGLSVSAWTANRPMLMRRLASCGVDAIMTDFPDRLARLLGSP